jgi:hypothetical protein
MTEFKKGDVVEYITPYYSEQHLKYNIYTVVRVEYRVRVFLDDSYPDNVGGVYSTRLKLAEFTKSPLWRLMNE